KQAAETQRNVIHLRNKDGADRQGQCQATEIECISCWQNQIDDRTRGAEALHFYHQLWQNTLGRRRANDQKNFVTNIFNKANQIEAKEISDNSQYNEDIKRFRQVRDQDKLGQRQQGARAKLA